MQISCISSLCELLARNESNITEMLDLYGAQREEDLKQKWLSGHRDSRNVLVRDLQHAAVNAIGDVTPCRDALFAGTIGSYGCSDAVFEGRCDETLPELDQVIVISQLWGYNYFHAIIEGLPRLVTALEYLQPAESASAWLVHSMMEQPLAAQVAEFMGVKDMVSGDIRASRLLVPMPTPCGGSVGGHRTIRLRGYIRARLPPEPLSCRRTLILVKRAGTRALANHADVLLAVQRLWTAGPVIEHDGSGTFLEQMARFAAAAAAVGPHGGGLTGMVAMPHGAAVAEVLPEQGTNRLNACYAALAHTLGLRYFALWAPGFDSDGQGVVPVQELEALPLWPGRPAYHEPECQ
jgi:hypothetical protein